MQKRGELYGKLGVCCYSFYFCYNGVEMCIDPSEETTYLGQLINHSLITNVVPRIVKVNDAKVPEDCPEAFSVTCITTEVLEDDLHVVSTEFGRSVSKLKTIEEGNIVTELRGQFLSTADSIIKRRELYYEHCCRTRMVYFVFQKRECCIDATISPLGKGRLINMAIDRPANLRPAAYLINGEAKVFFVATKNIKVNEELLYAVKYSPGSSKTETFL